jgi:alpha-beta hydrolase superfamily lysophospholipase
VASSPGAEPQQPSASPPGRSPRRWRWALIGAGVLAVLLLLAGVLAAWLNSNAVLVPDHSNWPEDVAVETVLAHGIVLERTEETIRPGVFGLTWQGGHAVAGPLLASDEDTVTRRLVDVDGYLVPDRDVGIDWYVYTGNPRSALGLPYRSVRVNGELGPMPAWLVPSRGRTWAIVVHGINSNPQGGLRVAPLFRRMGIPALYITYREDQGAPESPDGYHHMGLTEWHDLEAAARYAFSHGADRLVLMGYSMGGAIVTQFMEKSDLAARVDALVLEAPVLDWKKTIEFNATEMGFPGFAAIPVEWAIGARIDADWESLDAVRNTEDFQLPILLFHGTEDDIVPIETSDEFADELPDRVIYYRVPHAGHTQSWNVGPQVYQARVRRFLRKSLQNLQKRSEPDRGRARAAE